MIFTKEVKEKLQQSKLLARLVRFWRTPSYWPAIYLPDTYKATKRNAALTRFLHRSDYKERDKLAKTIVNKNKQFCSFEAEEGFMIKDYSQNTFLQQAIAYSLGVHENIDYDKKKKEAKKPFLLMHDFDFREKENSPIIDLACSEEILAPIAHYFGTMPLLSYAGIWYSPNKEMHHGSQKFHLDGGGYKQIKCFIPLYDITEECGPMNLLPAKESFSIYSKLYEQGKIKQRNTKVDDEVIYAQSQYDSGIQLTGKPGNIIFVDTGHCYHYGSRPANKPRLLLHLHYYMPSSPTLPMWGRKYQTWWDDQNDSLSTEIRKHVLGLSHLSCV